MLSEEKFMKPLKDKKIIDMLKIRGSIGQIGDDSAGNRWAYLTGWSVIGPYKMNIDTSDSPFTGYKESSIANPDLRWATVLKRNIGFDYAFLGGMFAGSFDWFRDDRKDIFIYGTDRSVPSYYGAAKTPDINKGEIKNVGFEVELRFNKVLNNGMRFWANTNYTYAHNKIILKDDPALIPSYRKAQGYSQGQFTSFIDNGFIGTYDELYSTPERQSSDEAVLIGDHYIVDFNGDGVVDNVNDQVPYGYSGFPQNTYNTTIGFEWNGFSCFAQFYGVTNVTRDVTMISFADVMLANVYDQGTWWSVDQKNADVITPRFNTPIGNNAMYYGTQYLCDGSYIRLKNVEVAYTFTQPWIQRLGLKNLKVFLSGNNLWLWTRMPDDRESNFGGNHTASNGAYPTFKRINFGVKFNL